MMGRKLKNSSVICSIVGTESVFEGTFATKETTRIDGTVKGKIQSESTLIIGESGKVEGNIFASNILVAGEVYGDLFATEKIEVTEAGRVHGNIKTKSLVMDENAVFQGKCEMNVESGESIIATDTQKEEIE